MTKDEAELETLLRDWKEQDEPAFTEVRQRADVVNISPSTPFDEIENPVKSTAIGSGAAPVVPSALGTPAEIASTSPAAAAPASTSVPPSVAGPYEFPFADPALQRMFENMKPKSTDDLVEILRQISYGKLGGIGDYIPYAKVRPMVCAIGLLLNHKGQTAPRFRLVRKETTFNTRDKSDSSNDLQVLDLHWLSLHSQVDPEPQWKQLFRGDMNFKAASRFVAQVRSRENKVIALGITEASQFMLSVIQTKKVADRWSSIQTKTENAVVRMREIADVPRSRFKHAKIAERRNDFMALSIAGGNATTAAEILPRIAGKPSNRSYMRKRTAWFIEQKIPAE